MTLLTRLMDAIRPPKNAVDAPAILRGDVWGDLGMLAGGLPLPSEQTVMQISGVYSCINLIAGAIATLPIELYTQKPDGELTRRSNDDLWWTLNEEFCPRWSASNGWEYVIQSLLLHGDGFAEIKRKGSSIVGLVPHHPERVTVIPSADGMRLVYGISDEFTAGRSGYRAVDQDDMLHIAGLGFNGLRAMSPLRHHLRMAGSVALATQEYSARFFANAARPDIALSTEQTLNAEQAADIRNKWQELYGGVENRGKVAVLGHGVKIQQLTMTLEDAQLIATRKFQIEEIARIYGVPPHMIGHTEKATSWGTGVETMGQGFVRFTLAQHLYKIQTEINRKFFRTAGRVARFNTFDLERTDMKSLFEALRAALGRAGEPGFLSVDEVRSIINYSRVPGGDRLFNGEQDAEPAV